MYSRTTGDHRIYQRDGELRPVVVAGKPGDDMLEGTLNAICRQAGISKDDLKRGKK